MKNLVLTSVLAAGLCGAGEGLSEDAPEGPYPPGIELPDSEGRALVERSCTRCHQLAGLSAYRGYWGRLQWRAMIDTMVKNGAVLSPDEQETVADYLTRHFGPAPASEHQTKIQERQ